MNLHPLLVHFPIVLLLIGALCDAIGIIGRRDFYLKVGYLCLALGAISSIFSALTGEFAAETAHQIPNIEKHLERHETLGTALALFSATLVLIRTHLVFKKQFKGAMQYAYLIAILMLAGLTVASGYTGGHLVYNYGAGTQPVIQKLPKSEEAPERIPRTNTFRSTP